MHISETTGYTLDTFFSRIDQMKLKWENESPLLHFDPAIISGLYKVVGSGAK